VSDRTARLDQLLREEISAIVAKDIADPRVGFVTVTQVEVTQDLGHATVWVSVIGDEATRKASLQALGRAMPYVRHRLGELRLRKIPELHLRHDDSVERGTRVLQLIDEVASGAPTDVPPPPLESLPAPQTIRGSPEAPVPSRPRSARTHPGKASHHRAGGPSRGGGARHGR